MIKFYDVCRNDRVPVLREVDSIDYESEGFTSPNKVYDFLCSELCLDERDDEYVYLIAFDYRMNMIGFFELSHGSHCSACIDRRGIAIRLVLAGASSFMVAHNHPCGDIIPSERDKEVCSAVKKLGDLLGIKLMDFLIIGNECYSFVRSSLL